MSFRGVAGRHAPFHSVLFQPFRKIPRTLTAFAVRSYSAQFRVISRRFGIVPVRTALIRALPCHSLSYFGIPCPRY